MSVLAGLLSSTFQRKVKNSDRFPIVNPFTFDVEVDQTMDIFPLNYSFAPDGESELEIVGASTDIGSLTSISGSYPTTGGLRFDATGLSPGQEPMIIFRIKVVDQDGYTVQSHADGTVRATGDAPDAFTEWSLENLESSSGDRFLITLDDPLPASDGLITSVVYRTSDDDATWGAQQTLTLAPGDGTQHEGVSLGVSVLTYVQIAPISAFGQGAWSGSFSVTTGYAFGVFSTGAEVYFTTTEGDQLTEFDPDGDGTFDYSLSSSQEAVLEATGEPQVLRRPMTFGAAASGGTRTGQVALWAYDLDNPPSGSKTWQWWQGHPDTGTPIGGATDPASVTIPTSGGSSYDLYLAETWDGIVTLSDAVSIPADAEAIWDTDLTATGVTFNEVRESTAEDVETTLTETGVTFVEPS